MNKKKNSGYGCGSIIAIILVCVFLIEFLPTIGSIALISFIIFGIYKYISENKSRKSNIESSPIETLNDNEETIETRNLTEKDLKEMVYRKNKLISEQNFDISEKNETIDKLNRKMEEQNERYEKVLSERSDLIFKQKLIISDREKEVIELKNSIEELERKIELESQKDYVKMEDLDPYTWEMALSMTQKDKCNASMIQRQLRIGFNRACKIADELYAIGIVGEDKESGFREILVDKYGITEIYSKLIGGVLEKKRKNLDAKKDLKIYELNNQILELKNAITTKNFEIERFQKTIENLKNEIGKIDEEHSERELRLKQEFQNNCQEYEEERIKIKSEITDIKTELKILNDKAIEIYYRFSDYSNITSQECLNELSILKTKENELRKSDGDVDIFDYSEKKKVVERCIRQILRNFNSECDNIITNIKIKNIDSVRDKIRKSYETLNNLYSKDGISLTDDILSLKLEQATLLYTYELKRIEEKEIQQAIKEQMIEEAKAEREIEQQKKKVEKDLQQHLGEVNRLMKYMQKTQIDAERQLYIEKIKELEDKIKNLEADKEAVLDREANAKAGFVYIISNIGSFGENIYKIGMTRRLEPMDRVKELSSASVPFEFDVHAMIFSSDAPELENMLHKHFADNAVNKVNPRKEFYKVDIDDIERVVKENYNDTVKFTKIPVAAEYRQSINLGMSVD